jgi:hypothetical protein
MFARALALAGMMLLLAACGVTGNFRNDPGYADFDGLRPFAGEPELALSLGPLPLTIARFAVSYHEPDLKPLVAELRAVRVYTFENPRDSGRVTERLDELRRAMLAEGWLSVVALREDDERTAVLLRPGANGANQGLAVIVQDRSEVVLVNLIGNVRLDALAGYMNELDVDVPGFEIDPVAIGH